MLAITIVGTQGSGKTKLLDKLTGKEYNKSYDQTIGTEEIEWYVPVRVPRDHVKTTPQMLLSITEISGNEKYSNMVKGITCNSDHYH